MKSTYFSAKSFIQMYLPCLGLKDENLEKIILHIWKYGGENISQLEAYKAIKETFPKWMTLMNECIKDLIRDSKRFNNPPYVVKDNQIGYIEHDGIHFNVNYGYKKLFAYLHENSKEPKTIPDLVIPDKMRFLITCGQFSFCEMPTNYFENFLGVTGTYRILNQSEKDKIINEYNIKRFTFTPSIFGESKRIFDEKNDVQILENQSQQFLRIFDEIKNRRNGKDQKIRAILVFFSDKKLLVEFWKSDIFMQFKQSSFILTEDANDFERDNIIKKATMTDSITLVTKAFGRGTDFICLDKKVEEGGGVHVIQTFLSKELSEEVQIKGRTARQGQTGSYSLILNIETLKAYNVTPQNIKSILEGSHSNLPNVKTAYDFLVEERKKAADVRSEKYKKYAQKNLIAHEASMKFMKNLEAGNEKEIIDYIICINKSNPVYETQKSRTICLLDATNSMKDLLDKSKENIDEMFRRTLEILKNKGVPRDCFELQIAVFRIYNSTANKLLEFSSWETDPNKLRKFFGFSKN